MTVGELWIEWRYDVTVAERRHETNERNDVIIWSDAGDTAPHEAT